MKIAIGCSMKYRELVRETIKNFDAIGITPLFPNLDYSTENKDDANTIEEKRRWHWSTTWQLMRQTKCI